jgi:hypothetical protein
MTVRDTASFQAAVDDAINSKGLRFIVANVALAQGPAPRARLSHREGLLRFVRIPRGNGKENDTAHGTYVTLELRGY